METVWRCLNERIEFLSRQGSDNNSTDTSHSTGSPPRKRLRLRRLHEFKTAKELEDLKSVATEVVELRDYAQWFKSRSQHSVDDILHPANYCEWFSSLGTKDKENVILYPYDYFTWFNYIVERGGEPPHVYVTKNTEHNNKIYGELALAHFNKIYGEHNSSEVYEYTRKCEILVFEKFIHLNFYARPKVSESRPEPGPERLFFAEVRTQNEDEVTRCCILESEEYFNADVIHPPDLVNCSDCMEDSEICGWECDCGWACD